MILAATGHRATKLGTSVAAEDALIALARRHLARLMPTQVISGMATGWDQAVAQAAVDLGIPFIAAVPFEGFGRKHCKETIWRFMGMLAKASQIEIISQVPISSALQRRNEWMVDRADKMLALWDGSWGGTFNCVQYAEKKGVPVENLWQQWELLNDPEILI